MLRPLSGTRRPRSRAFLGIVAAVLATNAFYLPIPVAHASFVGTGVGGFALSDCARIMIEAISAHAATPTSLHLVRLVLFGQPAYDTFVAVAREILGHGQDAA